MKAFEWFGVVKSCGARSKINNSKNTQMKFFWNSFHKSLAGKEAKKMKNEIMSEKSGTRERRILKMTISRERQKKYRMSLIFSSKISRIFSNIKLSTSLVKTLWGLLKIFERWDYLKISKTFQSILEFLKASDLISRG